MREPALFARRGTAGREAGFTLVELMITLVVLAAVSMAIVTVLIGSQRSKMSTSNAVETSQSARMALEMMARDLRSAGYGVDRDYVLQPQTPIAYIDSTQVLINENLSPFPDSTTAGGVPVHGAPLAYNPNFTPQPRPLVGTEWTPPTQYGSGAELVRYTLDVNNDGVVDQNDIAAPEGADAQRTKNPNDYTLVRQVYGASAGSNGGQTQRIALIEKPGGSVPGIFRVYMQGSSTPYDWANGPVPEGQLANIDRIVITVTATSPKPDWRGQYTETQFSSTVNSMRNTPSFGPPTYSVSGWVYEDVVQNHHRDAGEPGIPNVLVRLGDMYTTYTNGSGYFQFSVPAGSYVLRHTPAPGYGTYANTDTFLVAVPPPQQRMFADTMAAGGFLHVTAFNDLNANGTREAGEPGVAAVRITPTPGTVGYTDSFGQDSLFVGVGPYSVAVTPPDSFVVEGANPQSGTMVNHGSTFHLFPLVANAVGKVQGTVFSDNNRNGALNLGETGIQNVWVGVTDDGGTNILGWANTDANGAYSITVPANDPPHTKPYSVFCIPPAGSFPTSGTSIGNLWVQSNAILTGKNFGMARFQIISLNASRVLSLVSGDLIEKDWNGNDSQWQSKGARDLDIVLGADAGGTDNVSTWFNHYSEGGNPLFNADPDYTRNAPQSVLSLALDTLDTSSPILRPDLVTGTKLSASGNLFVWLNQNTSGNLGYVPSTFSPGMNYTTADGGDVTAVLTMDVAGGHMPDLIVGTKSPTSGRGTFEIWQNNQNSPLTFTRQEIYPPAGNISGGRLGEVTCMALADFNGDGNRDLVVGTKTGTYSGSLEFFRFSTKVNGARFLSAGSFSTPGMAITALTVLDVDGDGLLDVVCGVQDGSGSGKLQFWRNTGMFGSNFTFQMVRQVNAPGIVQSLVTADLGGAASKDIAMGWRLNETSYVGGVLIYYTDLGTLPAYGVDPSAGAVTNMVPALTANNFNFGVQPSTPAAPYLTDLAAGVKVTALTGALYVFIR